MTNHWRDIKHADVILINGANPAEAHPVGFQWFVKAKLDPTKGPGSGGGAKIIHADPRYTRTSALSDMYLRIRTGCASAGLAPLMRMTSACLMSRQVRHRSSSERGGQTDHR